jgi:hypothetical protein
MEFSELQARILSWCSRSSFYSVDRLSRILNAEPKDIREHATPLLIAGYLTSPGNSDNIYRLTLEGLVALRGHRRKIEEDTPKPIPW